MVTKICCLLQSSLAGLRVNSRADPGFLERGFICIKVSGFASLILSNFLLNIP